MRLHRYDPASCSHGAQHTDEFTTPDWEWVGDRRMFVMGYTSGGAPFGCYEDEFEDLV